MRGDFAIFGIQRDADRIGAKTGNSLGDGLGILDGQGAEDYACRA